MRLSLNKKPNSAALALVAALGFAALPAHAADLVLHNGEIYTVNASEPSAEAIAVDDGKIVFVGKNEDAQAFILDGTKVVDLEGRFAMPGIHDVHIHPLEANNPASGECLLKAGVRAERQLATIRECAGNAKGAKWVLGWGHYIDDVLGTKRQTSTAHTSLPASAKRPA